VSWRLKIEKGAKMKTEKFRAFTLPELMTVMVIIAILVGILVPALSQVKKLAKETKEKAQIGSIEIGIELYKNDFGEYPPSHGWKPPPADTNDYIYCGAQTLAEGMFGQDLLGFHPDSVYRADGWKKNGTTSADDLYPAPFDPVGNPDHKKNLEARKGAYLDRTNIDVFTPRQIFDRNTSAEFLEPDGYVICDVFTAVSRKITLPNGSIKTCKIGAPVLYFRANPSAEYTGLYTGVTVSEIAKNIYNYMDNHWVMNLGRITDGEYHKLIVDAGNNTTKPFYDYIRDPMILTLRRPIRPDSFILISAGNDGLYGTRDDICNFEPNMPG
jgi:prepilin-type N-terminal cleavage/methylation domain-containing protein